MNSFTKFAMFAVYILLVLLISIAIVFFIIYHQDSHQKECLLMKNQIEHPTEVQYINYGSQQIKKIESLQDRVNYNGQEIQRINRWMDKYQTEIDLVIDKNSQWLGFWVGIITFVLTLVTILLTYMNYKGVDDNRNMIKESIHQLESSIRSNRISCVTSCISSFPDSFAFSPETERREYIKRFMHILYREYSDYIAYIKELTENDKISDADYIKERDYVYLAWCNISVAINSAVYDFNESGQIIEYNNLHDAIDNELVEMHDNVITRSNIVEKMRCVQNSFERLVQVLN